MSDSDGGLLKRLTENVANSQKAAEAEGRRPKFPRGWEPHVTLNEKTGEAVSDVFREPDQDERDLIMGWLLDPDVWEIAPGTLETKRWQQQSGTDDWCYAYKAKLRNRETTDYADLDELMAMVDKHKPPKKAAPSGADSFVACLADWQIGKGPEGTGGSGPEKTAEAILQMIDNVEVRIKELRAAGRPLGTLYVAGMGDLIEQCSGNYPTQTFTVQLNRRDQMKVTVKLLIQAIKRWSALFESVVVLAVGGNHGENRQNGKKISDDADNDDVSLFETVALVLNENPDTYGHVKFVVPGEEMVVTLDLGGTIVAFTHGHIKRGGGNPQTHQLNWWNGQMKGKLPAGDADVLVTAHFHHYSYIDHGPRVHMQCPALDCGSKWFRDSNGADSKRGTLTFVVGDDGVDDVKVL